MTTDHSTSANPIFISSTVANISSTEKGSYSGHMTLGNLAGKEIFLWIENLKLCNERKIQQREPHMTI